MRRRTKEAQAWQHGAGLEIGELQRVEIRFGRLRRVAPADDDAHVRAVALGYGTRGGERRVDERVPERRGEGRCGRRFGGVLDDDMVALALKDESHIGAAFGELETLVLHLLRLVQRMKERRRDDGRGLAVKQQRRGGHAGARFGFKHRGASGRRYPPRE